MAKMGLVGEMFKGRKRDDRVTTAPSMPLPTGAAKRKRATMQQRSMPATVLSPPPSTNTVADDADISSYG